MSDTIPDLSEVYRGRSPEIAKLAAALCKAQAAMGGAKKDSTNPHFKNAYADLASIWDAVRKPLTDNGLAVVQFPRTTRNGVEVETMLVHSSGEYMTDVLWLPVLKMDAQGVGSAITYGRRYALMAVTGIAPVVDDDGNAAADGPPHKPGVPGTAGGGTDFRPATRRMPTSNWVDDAMNDGIVDQERTKGTLPLKPANGNGKPPAPDDRAKKIATKAREWVTTATATLKLSGQSVDSLSRFLADHAEQIRFLEDHVPEEHEKFFEAFNAASDAARARVS
jgi:hypothetical protein